LSRNLITISKRSAATLRVLLAGSVIVPAVLFAAAAVQNRNVLFEEASDRTVKVASILEQQAESTFRIYGQVFDRVAERVAAGLPPDGREMHRYLASLDRDLSEIDSIFLVEPDGRVVNHSRTFPVENVYAGDRDYFVTAKNGNGATAVGQPIAGRISGQRMLNIAHRISGPDGAFRGVVAISVSQKFFENFHRKLQASAQDSMTLIREDGTILARSPAPPTFSRYPAELFARAVATSGRGVFRTTSIVDGVERLYAYRKLDRYPVYVAFGQDTGVISARWRRNLATYAAIAVPASLVLLLTSWVALRRAREAENAARQLDEEIRHREQAEGALRQGQKMEAVGRLTGGIAHDFNNLLTAIAGNLELALGEKHDDKRDRRLRSGLAAVERGRQLTQRLLSFARKSPLQTSIVDTSARLRELRDLFAPTLPANIEFALDAPDDLWPVEIEEDQLQVALLNLVVNARDSLEAEGSIRVVGRNVRLSTAQLDGDFVEISVRDTGVGIPDDLRSRLFEPFFTTKASGKGSGLGLAQVYGFAKRSGGDVTVESAVQRGTTISIYLPRATAAPAEAPEPREDGRLRGSSAEGSRVRRHAGRARGPRARDTEGGSGFRPGLLRHRDAGQHERPRARGGSRRAPSGDRAPPRHRLCRPRRS
jgi:two-component system NtrC family sensor kinase